MAKPKSLKAIEGSEMPAAEPQAEPKVEAPVVKPEVRSREEIFAGIVVESY